jgi:DNA-binding transcriptional LysR family regulator
VNTLDFIYLQTFREVALRQSFTRAAEALGYAQSSVTTQIQKLERDYQVQLFERFGKGLRLTSAGEELLKIAVQMLDLYAQSKEKLARQGGGTLAIGTIDSLASYYLPPLIQQIRHTYPDLAIKLQTDREDVIVNKVKDGELDIGLVLEREPSDAAMKWLTIREEPLVLIVNPKHPLTGRERVELDDLNGWEWIMAEPSCNYRMMLEKTLRSTGTPYHVGLELGNPEAIKRCIMAGAGISLLPAMVAEEEIRRGELAVIPFVHHSLRLDLQLVIHPKKWVSHALTEFIEMIQSSANAQAD